MSWLRQSPTSLFDSMPSNDADTSPWFTPSCAGTSAAHIAKRVLVQRSTPSSLRTQSLLPHVSAVLRGSHGSPCATSLTLVHVSAPGAPRQNFPLGHTALVLPGT